MSFFGFDTSGHNKGAPGFSQAHDPFAGLGQDSSGEALDFDDTYDGLGDQLDETDDAFNDDTFGGGDSTDKKVGKDFDFFGQTAKVANAIDEEHMRYNRSQPTQRPAQPIPEYQYSMQQQSAPRPVRSGYEKYKESEPVPDMQVDAALWGVAPKKQASQAPAPIPVASASRKMMSLEEVEAAMRAQSSQPSEFAAPGSYPGHGQLAHQGFLPQQGADYLYAQQQQVRHVPSPTAHLQHGQGQPSLAILQRPQSRSPADSMPHGLPQGLAPQQQRHAQVHRQPSPQGPSTKPMQILQNPNRHPGDNVRLGSQPNHQGHRQQNSFSQTGILTHPSQLSQLSDEEKNAYLEAEARRAKRNHKIFMLSKDNGLMTPQDKNFITRIQLQQLVAATGNPMDQGADDHIAEDFYYQVHSQIRGGHRQHPGQPLNNFAQTYLYQTGSRQAGARRHNRGPENHVQRMEQQVQRAVEAAKSKPKNKQLVIEGSLGKISFSNAKTPKPLLNIKRTDSASDANRPGSSHKAPSHSAIINRKSVLSDIEKVYETLMRMEDHDRKMPPPNDSSDPELVRVQMEWQQGAAQLNNQLWTNLKVHEPIGATAIHPFIAFLSYPKGKKALPRVFRHISYEQRCTILTMIVVHLDKIDVVRDAATDAGETLLNAALRENIELFSVAVMSTLFNFMNELNLDIVTGVLGIISGLSVDTIARTRIGASMLTMILSRAEILKQGGAPQQLIEQWNNTYNNFFTLLEPTLPRIFPGSVNSGQDIYVWQLLAALGIGANQDQQQRLVLGVKDRVMDTVALSKTLPQDMAQARLQNVNLFMRSIGLDVELLV
ncbi:hypothetical protein MCOR27_002008 [Pyricularia oryzae]|nr:hypothetical protein MCOR01_002708 [Pyricularia oryzae]KAI6258814.1 hypothetical protein MCOR19_004833 [Pyricularia oryzae]KAI6285990.1 hypothetical protein MCOR27_002008 [Pyricularia oryzae]KAI6321747.1 hypothetical protein MCOR34_002516 [Pyricularia oryzae]KAI6323369.1 hypothetical protein MCOR29_004502 [Pyricularia oryzae]